MISQSRVGRLFLSPLMAWVVGIGIISYYMISFDKKMLSQPVESAGWASSLKHYASAMKFAYIKKGIDLAGGTYLVLGVEIEKAIELRLLNESKSFETLFSKKELNHSFKQKEIKSSGLVLEFADAAAAKACQKAVQETRGGSLVAKASENVFTVSLAQEEEARVRNDAVEQAVRVLSNRLGGYGVEGIVVQQHGDRQVVIQLPGVDDPESVKDVVTKTANLEFKIVEKMAASRESLLEDFDGDLPSDKVIIPGRAKGSDGEDGFFYLVSAYPDLAGNHISNASVDYDQFGKRIVTFKLDGQGSRDFSDLTANNIGRSMAIVIDNVVYSAPRINVAISGGAASIEGQYTPEEAFELAVVLKSGSLQAPLKVEQENRVGASLGQDSIYNGILSCIVALALIFLFSVFYYKIPGFFAVLTLLCNIFLTLLFLSYFKATLTLPGVAGIVLTIGMAIDASILIYERIKEELAAGHSLRKSINEGFAGVMAVILDSNITTFLTGLVLYQFGGPAIKGFAVTLMAGIVATLLSGIYFLKALFAFLLDVCDVHELKF